MKAVDALPVIAVAALHCTTACLAIASCSIRVDVSLIVLAFLEWVCGGTFMMHLFITTHKTTRLVSLACCLGCLIVGVYWIDSHVIVRHLHVAVLTLLIVSQSVSGWIRVPESPASAESPDEPHVKVKDSSQTLVPKTAVHIGSRQVSMSTMKEPKDLQMPQPVTPAHEMVILPDNQFSEKGSDTGSSSSINSDSDSTNSEANEAGVLAPAFHFPEPIKEEEEEEGEVDISKAALAKFQNDIELLDNLIESARPANHWPQFSTGSELNTVSPQSWRENSSYWMNSPRPATLFTSDSTIHHSKSYSESAVSVLAPKLALGRQLSPELIPRLTPPQRTHHRQDPLDSAYTSISGPPAQSVHELYSIMSQSYYDSYETLSQLETSPASTATPLFPPSPSHASSHSGSPLRRLMTFRDSHPRHTAHSRSVPELNFHLHHKSQSSNSLRSHYQKQHQHQRTLSRKSHSQFELVESPAGQTQLVVQGSSDDSMSTESNSASDTWSQQSTTPSCVVGEYDKEKWRVIQRRSEQHLGEHAREQEGSSVA